MEPEKKLPKPKKLIANASQKFNRHPSNPKN
jgi:hypothetical protein